MQGEEHQAKAAVSCPECLCCWTEAVRVEDLW